MNLSIEIAGVYYKYGFCYFPYLTVVDFHLLLNLIRSHRLLLCWTDHLWRGGWTEGLSEFA